MFRITLGHDTQDAIDVLLEELHRFLHVAHVLRRNFDCVIVHAVDYIHREGGELPSVESEAVMTRL